MNQGWVKTHKSEDFILAPAVYRLTQEGRQRSEKTVKLILWQRGIEGGGVGRMCQQDARSRDAPCASSQSPIFLETNAKTPVLQQVSKYQTERQPHNNISVGRLKIWTLPRFSCHGRSESAGDVLSSRLLKHVQIMQHLHDGPRKQKKAVQRTQDLQKRIIWIL